MHDIIAIVTDFGNRDHYNGVMKGTILGINPNAKIVDLATDVDSFSIEDAAFILYASAPYFPKGTIFLAVVDPGVGTSRNAVAVECTDHFFVGPDNGVLYPAASREGIIRSVKLGPSRGTFDGRDIFAPAAALISLKGSIEGTGENYNLHVKFEFGNPSIKNNIINARIIHVDKFGDIVTNIKKELFSGVNKIKYEGMIIERANTFSDCSGICFIEGSSGFIEIVANRSRASDKLGLFTGKELRLEII